MLRFETNPSMKEKVLLIHALKKDMKTYPVLKPNAEENNIAAIYDDDILCGGALILGNEKPGYLCCFFENPDYCTGEYYTELKTAVLKEYQGIDLFNVDCIKVKL